MLASSIEHVQTCLMNGRNNEDGFFSLTRFHFQTHRYGALEIPPLRALYIPSRLVSFWFLFAFQFQSEIEYFTWMFNQKMPFFIVIDEQRRRRQRERGRRRASKQMNDMTSLPSVYDWKVLSESPRLSYLRLELILNSTLRSRMHQRFMWQRNTNKLFRVRTSKAKCADKKKPRARSQNKETEKRKKICA